ncbi:hypothetical protein LA080_011717 [Diaporthe eres]|nr:hypothetical protein LA080_011717 [Diaporthe eres]
MARASANAATRDAWNLNGGAVQPCRPVGPIEIHVFLCAQPSSKPRRMCSREACDTVKMRVKSNAEGPSYKNPKDIHRQTNPYKVTKMADFVLRTNMSREKLLT